MHRLPRFPLILVALCSLLIPLAASSAAEPGGTTTPTV